jgi:hypothetical protein
MNMRRSRTIEVAGLRGAALAAGLVVIVAVLCGGSGCGRQVIGVAKPGALLEWEPQPKDTAARITAVKVTAARTYVGFSNGERFFKANTDAAWTHYDEGPPGCDQPTPQGPVTAFAVTEATTFVSFAGYPGAPGLWRSPDDRSCWAQIAVSDDFRSLSVSPFAAFELLAVGRSQVWASHDLGGAWEYGGQPTSFHFDGAVQAMAVGVSSTGAPRAWVGDAEGHVSYSDDLMAAPAGGPIRWTLVAPDPGFPHRRVVAISISVERPQTVWVTFAGLRPDSLWTSDGGVSWRNPQGGELATVLRAVFDAGAGTGEDAGAADAATFTAVSPVPALDAAYVTALVPDRLGHLSATSFWASDGSDDWWRM